MSTLIYDDAFYKNRNRDSQYAAEKILKIVFSEMPTYPNSIVDIGCGVGTWLRVAKEKYGVENIIGIDGEYVPKKYIQISESKFIAENIETYEEKKLLEYNHNNRFDLVISMEVAEHLDKKYAREFVKKLCNLGDVICFSAAVPKQGGDGHINEQRLSYWKNIFEQNRYLLGDVVRADIWNDKKIPVWYRNNTVLFYSENIVEIKSKHPKYICDIVHPDMYEKKIYAYEKEIKQLRDSRNIRSLIKGKLSEWIKNSRL